jgi:hypothetical protein
MTLRMWFEAWYRIVRNVVAYASTCGIDVHYAVLDQMLRIDRLSCMSRVGKI